MTDAADGVGGTEGTFVVGATDGVGATDDTATVGATVCTNIIHFGVTDASDGMDGTNAMDGSDATDRTDFTPTFGKGTDSFTSASNRSTSFHITYFAKSTTLSSGAYLSTTD